MSEMPWVEVNLTLYIKADGSEVRYEPHWHPDEANGLKGAVRAWPDEDGLPELSDFHAAYDALTVDAVEKAWRKVFLSGNDIEGHELTRWLPLDEDSGPEFGR